MQLTVQCIDYCIYRSCPERCTGPVDSTSLSRYKFTTVTPTSLVLQNSAMQIDIAFHVILSHVPLPEGIQSNVSMGKLTKRL